MDTQIVFYLQLTAMMIASILVARWYVLPKAYSVSLYAALAPLLLFSATRVSGLFFLLPQMTNNMPDAFARPAAYGDFTVGIIALVAALAIHMRSKAGIVLTWIYAVLGAADFIYALYLGNANDMPLHLGASWPMVTFMGPAMMVTIVVIWILLLKHPKRD